MGIKISHSFFFSFFFFFFLKKRESFKDLKVGQELTKFTKIPTLESFEIYFLYFF
jgi:hypothetical protein